MPFRRRVPEQPTGSPPPLIPPSLSLFPHLAGARFHGCIPLSERRQHAWGPGTGDRGLGAGASPNTLVFVSGSTPANGNKPRLFRPLKADKRRSLVDLQAFRVPNTLPACTRGGEANSPSIRWPPRKASRCVFVTVPCQEGGLERVLRTNPLRLRKCSSVLASLWLANRAFLSAGRVVPAQGALRDTDSLRRSRGSSGISR